VLPSQRVAADEDPDTSLVGPRLRFDSRYFERQRNLWRRLGPDFRWKINAKEAALTDQNRADVCRS